MQVYLLNDKFERIVLLDEFKSLVWTERMSAYGDFEMTLWPSRRWDNIFIGRYIEISGSRAAMMIQAKQEITDSSGEKVLKISGRSLEALFMTRTVIPWASRPTWKYKGPTGRAVYFLVRNFALLENDMGLTRDIIPDAYMFDGTDDTTEVEFAVGIKSLYDAVKEICDSKNLTFGADLRKTSPKIRFYVEEGVERNITYSTLTDTLTEPSFLHTQLDYYNTAYIYSKDGKYRTSIGAPTIYREGLERKVLAVYASDLDVDEDVTTSQLIDQMQQRGREELAKHKELRAFDGQLTGTDPYIYRTHYQLGDIVTLMDQNGRQEKVRVTEYIFSQDSEGVRDYPTFSALD